MPGHNDGVRLILEGSTLEGNTAFDAGGAILSRGSSIEVRKGISRIQNNVAEPTMEILEALLSSGNQNEEPRGSGGGLAMTYGGSLTVSGPESVLEVAKNWAFFSGGGIATVSWLWPTITYREEDWEGARVVVESGGTLSIRNNHAMALGGGMYTMASRAKIGDLLGDSLRRHYFMSSRRINWVYDREFDICSLPKTSPLLVTGSRSRLISQGNSANLGGGLLAHSRDTPMDSEVQHCASWKERFTSPTITPFPGTHKHSSCQQ
jgi:hypothetical protein